MRRPQSSVLPSAGFRGASPDQRDPGDPDIRGPQEADAVLLDAVSKHY
jgi:hypothetical protein